MNRTEHGPKNLAARVGGWSARHRWRAMLIWLVFVAVAGAIGSILGTTGMVSYEDENGDSRRAQQILEDAGFNDTASETIVIQARNGTLSLEDPAFRATVRDVARAVEATGEVEQVRTPLDAESPTPINEDGTTALLVFDINGSLETSVERVAPVLDSVDQVGDDHPDFLVEEAGTASAARAVSSATSDDLREAELVSLPLTAIILLVAFGTLLPVLIPITLSMTSFVAATGLLALTSRLMHVDEATTNLMLLIGLAVGVDYSLFYLNRAREERGKGLSKQRSLEIAAATSGRAVLISGVTVIIAVAGLFITGNGVFMGFAQGTILVVLTAVVGSVTILPAILSVLGDGVDARLVHGIVRVATRGRVTWPRRIGIRTHGGRMWRAVLGAVLRRPVVSVALSAGALVALAIPATDLKTGQVGLDDLQGDFPIVETFDRIERAFPGATDPASVVLRAPDASATQMRTAIQDFREAALSAGVGNEPFEVETSADGTVANISMGIPGEGPQDERSVEAVETLRQTIVPETLDHLPGAEALVTGSVAGTMDFNEQMSRTVPMVFGSVLLLAFVLLLVSFRSLVIAIKAIILNLLSVAAAYGVLVLVFQRGLGEELLGFNSTGVIVNWLPLFLFVILLGLSMDYQVFIVSRMREAHDRGMPSDQAIAYGITATAPVVTCAALIMVAVFSVFVTMSLLSFVQMGVGLAVAILIDATIVRAVLLPASMKLLGDWNWYLPGLLSWLPELSPSGQDPEAEQVGATERDRGRDPVRAG